MSELASRGQLRAGFLRRAVVMVPLILLLGFGAGRLAPAGSANPWYAQLAKPDIRPPDWAFPVAWTLIYVLLGFAVAMILNARGARGRTLAVALFAAQMVANLVWTPLFFGAHEVSAALVVIIVMFVLALATTLAFGRIRPLAAWLMVPYLAWLVIATALTWQIDRMNPDAEGLASPPVSTQIEL